MHSVTTRFFVPRDTDFVSDHLVAFYKNNAPPKKNHPWLWLHETPLVSYAVGDDAEAAAAT